jgi:hypothetical protein
MLAYLSVLVELNYFDTIYLNFLIVGHTHGPDDQLFSVISKKVLSARFIGSPMAMEALIKTAHKRSEDRPYLVKRIKVAHDIKTAMDPFINNAIHRYQFPHCFLFERVEGKAIMRYKLFSTYDEWLPKKPSSIASQQGQIMIPEYPGAGGIERVLREAEITDSEGRVGSTSASRQLLANFNAVEQQLRALDEQSNRELIARFAAQSDGADEILPEHEKAATEIKLAQASKHNEGGKRTKLTMI